MDLQNNLLPIPSPRLSSSDENQNQLLENGEQDVDGRPKTSWIQSQEDSVNNNEEEEGRGGQLVDNSNEASTEVPRKQSLDSPGPSSRHTWDTVSGHVTRRCCPMCPMAAVSSCPYKTPDTASEGGPSAPRLGPSLVALLEELVERPDYALLPQCLHQIAEAFFLEEDYEQAVQFIQLERLYHERLLSNLAALQEQWESWGKEEEDSMEGRRASGRPLCPGLEAKQLEALRRVCRTHLRSTLGAEKCPAVDEALRNSLCSWRPSVDLKQDTAQYPHSSEGHAESPGMIEPQDVKEASSSESSTLLAAQGLQWKDSSLLNHQGAPPHSPPLLATPTTAVTGGHCLNDCKLTGSSDTGVCETAAVEPRIDAGPAGIARGLVTDILSQRRSGEEEGEEERRRTDLTTACPEPSADASPEAAQATERCDSETAQQTAAGQHGHSETVDVAACSLEGGANSGSAGEMSSESSGAPGEEQWDCGAGEEEDEEEEEGGAGEEQEKPEIVEVEVVEEESVECEPGFEVECEAECKPECIRLRADNAGGVWLEETGAPQDSLDDLAKRIQVEETTPAHGLVSILKRRSSAEESSASSSLPPKQTPRRKVRFREPEHMLDQDEGGGDSWLLLLLLCLVTMVVSVGGTALYCAVGDVQSSVCTDFSRNVDFYFGQAQRGLEELRHWLSSSSS